MTKQSYHTEKTDSSSYALGYQAFLKRTDFREKVLAEFERSVPLHIGQKDTYKILDIGCGNGEMTFRYVQSLASIFPKARFEVHLLEPSLEAINIALKRLQNVVSDIKVYNSKADEFFQIKTSNEFDLIIASYVFYHLSAEIINSIVRSLEKDGALCVLMGSKEHPLRTDPALREISKHGDSSSLKEVLSKLVSNEVVTANVINTKTNLDLNGLIDNGVLTDEGKRFFAFMYNIEVSDFPEASKLALDSLLDKVYGELKGVVNPSHEVIWISKK